MASKNTLGPDTHRLGWLIDGNDDTPLTAVLLEDDGQAITLTVPWPSGDSPYAHWFSFGMNYTDDPERTRRRYEVPEVLWFHDVRGQVALVGCQAWRGSIGGAGEGIALTRFAVLGAEPMVDYTTINGLRSELPGLSHWMHLRSLTHDTETDGEGRLRALTLRLEAPEPIRLAQTLNLRLRPSFHFQLAGRADTSTVHETLLIESRTKDAREWHEHLAAHNSVRDLLSIAAWFPFGYAAQWVIRDDDPLTAISGDSLGEKWSELRSYVSPKHNPLPGQPRFLFYFDDVGSAGLRRWSALRDRFARGVNPILTILDEPNTPGMTALAQLGIGLDAIGYQLALEQSMARRRAKEESHQDRLRRTVADLAVDPQFDTEEWVIRSAEVYNGVKHANRDLPEGLVLGRTLRQNRLIFRLWVASRIGVPRDRLLQGMRNHQDASDS